MFLKRRCCLLFQLRLQHGCLQLANAAGDKAYEGEYPQAFSNPSISLMLPGSFLAWSILQVLTEENLP